MCVCVCVCGLCVKLLGLETCKVLSIITIECVSSISYYATMLLCYCYYYYSTNLLTILYYTIGRHTQSVSSTHCSHSHSHDTTSHPTCRMICYLYSLLTTHCSATAHYSLTASLTGRSANNPSGSMCAHSAAASSIDTPVRKHFARASSCSLAKRRFSAQKKLANLAISLSTPNECRCLVM
jgi:hypothetical protein